MKTNTNALIGTYEKQPTPIGAGGYVICWDQSSDGTRMTHGADVSSGGYVRNVGDPYWKSMFSPQTLLPEEYDPMPAAYNLNDSRGMCAVRIAPSNKDIIYAVWGGWTFKSTDGGLTQRRTGMHGISHVPNSSSQRYWKRMIDVHPTDANRVLFGSSKSFHGFEEGLFCGASYTIDGGVTGVKIAGLPDVPKRIPMEAHDINLGARVFVAYDPTQPSNCYVFVNGYGLYKSTTGETGTFSLVANSPLYVTSMEVHPNGNVYMALGWAKGANPTNVDDICIITRAGAVSYKSTTGYSNGGALQLAVNPLDANHMIILDANSHHLSYNGGDTWETFYPWNGNSFSGSGEIAWLSNKGPYGGAGSAAIHFDTVVPNKAWFVHGLGVDWAILPTAPGGTITYHDYSQGNEEKVARCHVSIPGNPRIILGNWDYSIWPMDDLDAWKNKGIVGPQPNGGNGLAIATDLDYAEDDKNFVVCSISQTTGANLKSEDGGTTWSLLPNQVPEMGNAGSIAVNRKNNIIWTGTNNAKGYYTKDGGATWKELAFGGQVPSRYANAFYVNRYNITADKTRPNTFALLYSVGLDGQAEALALTNMPLSGGGGWPVADGYTAQAGVSIGLVAQNNAAENGLYTVNGTASSWTLIRHVEYDTFGKINGNAWYLAGGGATERWGRFKMTLPAGGTLGTSPITVARDDTAVHVLGGMWVTTDGGDTWEKKISGVIGSSLPGFNGDDRQFWQAQLKYIPGYTGELLYSPHADNGNDFLMHIANDSVVTRIGTAYNLRAVTRFAFGKNAPGQTRPAVFFWGTVNGVRGAYVTYDWFATTPVLLDKFPLDNLSGITTVGADINKFGRYFVGGIGWVHYTYGKRMVVKG